MAESRKAALIVDAEGQLAGIFTFKGHDVPCGSKGN
jgi:hypothetical protein